MTLEELLVSIPPKPWYRRWFPWLPYFYYGTALRLLVVTFDVPSYTQPVTRKHLFDWLRSTRSGRIVGFQLWIP